MSETDRTERVPIELAETRKGTHLMDLVNVPDGFVAPSAVIQVQIQSAQAPTNSQVPAADSTTAGTN
jgi:hypothetical protein